MADSHSTRRSHNFKDLSGKAFGRLRVIRLGGKNKRGLLLWSCVCDESLGGCGKAATVTGDALRTGNTTSCGCARQQRCVMMKFKHGMKKTPEWTTWQGMIARCTNPNHSGFARYGGRGIKVCDRWQEFVSFYADMGPRPSQDHSLERVDANGDYQPGNVVWADRKQQARNKRNNRLVTAMGKTQCVAAWAEELGIKPQTIYYRLAIGESGEQALRATRVHRSVASSI